MTQNDVQIVENFMALSHPIKVSVKMITYNHEAFIAEAIESVLMQQTSFDYELVIGEDCSTDKTREIILDYQKKYPEKIRLILPKQNLGPRRNTANVLAHCRGQYVAFLDGDDSWTSPDKLQRQADYLDSHPETVICAHNAYNLLFDGSKQDYVRGGFSRHPKSLYSLNDILFENFLPTCSLMYRNGVLPEIPEILNTFPVGDWIRNVLHAQYGNIAFLDEYWGIRRRHAGGAISGKPMAEIAEMNIKCIHMICDHFGIDYRSNEAAKNRLSLFANMLAKLHFDAGNAPQAKYYLNIFNSLQDSVQKSAQPIHSKTQHPEKIVIITEAFPVITETFVLDQITGLIDRGANIEIWSSVKMAQSQVHQNVERYNLLARTRYLRYPAASPNISPTQWTENFLRINQIDDLQTVKSFHIHFGPNFNRLAPLFASCPEKYVLVSFHGYDASKFFKTAGDHCYDYLFHRANLITTPSQYLRNMLVNKGAALDKIRIHHYGVDLDAFQPGKSKGNEAKPVVFLSVARFVPKKGLEYALRAFAAVTQDHNVVYKIIGEGPLYQSLVNLAKELHIEDKVRFEGFKTKPDIVKEMAQADIFVLTSATAPDGDQEGLPVSLIEAQAMSLPVVATSHSGIPELVINHETGLLAPEKAVDQISAHMRALVSDVKLRITLGEKGRRRVQDEFNISQLNDRLFNCLTKHIDLPIQADEFFKTTHINAQFDVIMVWYQNDWGLYGRRNEMLARYLIKHPQIRKVIHLEPPLNMDMLEDSSTPATFDSNLDVNLARTREVVDSEVVLFTPHFHTGMTPAEIKSAVTQQVHDLISAHQLQNVILWLYPPHWFTNLMLDQFGATAQMIISDCVDDHRQYASSGKAQRQIERQYEKTIEASDLVFCVSDNLRRDFSHYNQAAHFIPNAVPLIDEPGEATPTRPVELAELEGPIIGYAGALSFRLDCPLLEGIARHRPDWNLVLIGTSPSPQVQQLAQRSNVYLIDPQKYTRIPDYITHFDVCIIPHLVDDITDQMNPLKLYLYLALGKPVVSTSVAGVSDFSEVISIEKNHDEFIIAIENYLSCGQPEAAQARINAVKAHNWTNRVNEMLELSFQTTKKSSPQREKSNHYYEFSRPEVQALVTPSSRRILDVGCASGNLGADLKHKLGAEVWGIEYVSEVADRARQKLDQVITGSVDEALRQLPDHYFDTIIFADVLEHLVDPYTVLKELKQKLTDQGEIVASIPNIRHWSVVKDLLEGRWDYTDAGLLDKTHLRFFTKKSVFELFKQAGYKIDRLGHTEIQNYGMPQQVLEALTRTGLDTSTLAEESKHYQYLVRAKLKQTVRPLTSIIMLTHNQWDYTKLCLDSIERYTHEPYELIMVDNASTDKTLDSLRQYQASRPNVRIIANASNRGFAAGNNQGLAAAKGDFVVLLNNDTVVSEGWLSRMLAVFERNPEYDLVGPMSNYVSGPQLVTQTQYNNLEEMQQFAADWYAAHAGQIMAFPRIVGFCLMVRRAVIDELGGLDERFGTGNFEDDDYCLRAIQAGFKIGIAQDVFIHHTGHQTFKGAGIDYQQSLAQNWEIFKAKWAIPAQVAYGENYLSYTVSSTTNRFIPLPSDPGIAVSRRTRTIPKISLLIAGEEADDVTQLNDFLTHLQQVSSPDLDLKRCVASSDREFSSLNDDISVLSEPASTALRAILTTNSSYVVLLSPDVILPQSWLNQLMVIGDSDPTIAAVGPLAKNAPKPQQFQLDSPDPMSEFEAFANQHAQAYQGQWKAVPYLGGFCLLLKSHAVKVVGGLSDSLPLNEALFDLFERLQQFDFKLACAKDVYLHHEHLSTAEGADYDDLVAARIAMSQVLAPAESALTGGKFEEAVDHYKRIVQTYPNLAAAQTALGMLLLALSRTAEALPVLQRAVELSPQVAAILNQLGIAYYRLGQQAEAETAFSQASEQDPADLECRLNLVDLYRDQGRYEAASIVMKEALTLDPQHPDVLVSYGFLCLAVGDPEGARLALEHLESSSTEHPGSVALRKALKEVNTALVRKDEIRLQVEEAQQQEDWPQAITRLEQLLKIPDLTAEEAASYWNSLGYAYIMDDQLNAAEAAFLQGLKSRADQLDLLSNLADLYLQQAKFEEATEYLKRALTVDANDINVLLSLGNCCVELEAFDTALEAFQRVESLAPETLAVRDVIEQLESIVLT